MPATSFDPTRWNTARWSGGPGHYESWFQRANHPTRPLAFWIRYTIFAPQAGPAEGELWAIWFDGEQQRVVAVKSEHPIDRCRFDRGAFDVSIDDATLGPDRLVGRCSSGGHRLDWSLHYDGGGPPLLLLPEPLYEGGFPKAKALVGAPLCRYAGTIDIDGEAHDIDGWLGSQNHNWGVRHTDRYAWGQVAGFDERDDALLECTTAKLRIGPLWTPWLTLAVLRVGGETFAFNTMARSPFASASIDALQWSFDAGNGRERLRAAFTGDPARVVALTYRNPPGGAKICLNTKLAACTVELERPGQPMLALTCRHRAAFELLRDDPMGFPVLV